MKNTIQIIAILTLIVTTSCGESKKETVDNRPTVSVIVSTPSTENGTFITASGKIEAVQNANISTRMMGFVTKIHVNVGQKVTKGQLLISINSADIAAQKAQINASITEATAAYKNAEKDYNRFKSLFETNSASQKEMDDITANFQMAKARLEAANQMKNQLNAQLSYSNITAPFSGVITGKFINKGDMATPGIPLLSIENPTNFQVIAMVPESEITSIKTGTTVQVIVKSTNQKLTGKVTEVSTSTKNTGGQYLVKVVLDKSEVNLLSGMFTSIQFPTENTTTTSKILVPTNALIHKGELTGVYVVGQNNTALLRWLRLGRQFGDKTEILSGLSVDEQFVVSSKSKLTNGAKLQIQ
ncbi:efflux RND transporter periplasmic adaptor subunit [uncultured Lutibacter sp.]|uniref:efflux RND transporter periplasmic adaptor subunit n=1 Tax=uncultured Lutibacter sp. TaxID=437739 RepID=UPI0026186343|nr:efflux RND transporter periplasmic adaptor subunit [uncultured Lutibacter sp.]